MQITLYAFMHTIYKRRKKLFEHISFSNASRKTVTNFYTKRKWCFDIYVPLLVECTEFLWDGYCQFSFKKKCLEILTEFGTNSQTKQQMFENSNENDDTSNTNLARDYFNSLHLSLKGRSDM